MFDMTKIYSAVVYRWVNYVIARAMSARIGHCVRWVIALGPAKMPATMRRDRTLGNT